MPLINRLTTALTRLVRKYRDLGKGADYPKMICLPCGAKYGAHGADRHTMLVYGICGLCGSSRNITSTSNFGGLCYGWEWNFADARENGDVR